MLDAPHHSRPDDVELPEVDSQSLSQTIHGFWSVVDAHRSTAIPTELDGRFCSNLVGISCRTLNDIFFWIRPADVQMLHATHHRRPMMSNYQMLIGGACQEVIHSSGQVHFTFGQ